MNKEQPDFRKKNHTKSSTLVVNKIKCLLECHKEKKMKTFFLNML